MNEGKLKEIWQRKNADISPANVDFQKIRQRSEKAQKKLRNKVKWDIAFNIAGCLILIPVIYKMPEFLYFLPFFIAVWVWYLWEMKNIYNLETDFRKFENVKDFLIAKQKLLQNYIKRTRYIGYSVGFVFMPLYVLTRIGSTDDKLLIFISGIVGFGLTQLVVGIMLKVYLRYFYIPVLDETENLLQQLNEN